MSKKPTRDQIIQAADDLFYQQGYEHTSFADISDEVQISRGNFYYHFKTKDEILDAVISHRLANTEDMLAQWELSGELPEDRIRSFIHILIQNGQLIKRHGCPVGTLCTELSKLDHRLQGKANELFTLFRIWLKRQFELMGQKAHADEMAMHVLAMSQGVAVIANAFHDEKFVRQEVRRMENWLESARQQR